MGRTQLSENMMAVKIWFNRLNLWLIEWQVSQLFEVVRRDQENATEIWMLLPFTDSNKPLKYTTQLPLYEWEESLTCS